MVEKKRGIIINITSGAARTTLASTGAYSVSKAGVIALTECLAIDLLPCNIRVNSIGPGPVRSQFNTELWQDPKKREEYESKLPFKRFAACGKAEGLRTR